MFLQVCVCPQGERYWEGKGAPKPGQALPPSQPGQGYPSLCSPQPSQDQDGVRRGRYASCVHAGGLPCD